MMDFPCLEDSQCEVEHAFIPTQLRYLFFVCTSTISRGFVMNVLRYATERNSTYHNLFAHRLVTDVVLLSEETNPLNLLRYKIRWSRNLYSAQFKRKTPFKSPTAKKYLCNKKLVLYGTLGEYKLPLQCQISLFYKQLHLSHKPFESLL